MPGETSTIRTMMRHIMSDLDNNFLNATDEAKRKKLANFLLEYAEHITSVSSAEPYKQLAHQIQYSRSQLLTPEAIIKASPTYRDNVAHDFLAELAESFMYDLDYIYNSKAFPTIFSRICDETYLFAKRSQSRLPNRFAGISSEHQDRVSNYRDIFQSHHEIFELIKKHSDTIRGSRLFENLQLPKHYDFVFEYLTDKKPEDLHVPEAKIPEESQDHFDKIKKKEDSVERTKRKVDYFSQLQQQTPSEETKYSLIKAHYILQQFKTGTIAKIKQIVIEKSKDPNVDDSGVCKAVEHYLKEQKVSDYFIDEVLSSIKNNTDGREIFLFRDRIITKLDERVKVAEFIWDYYYLRCKDMLKDYVPNSNNELDEIVVAILEKDLDNIDEKINAADAEKAKQLKRLKARYQYYVGKAKFRTSTVVNTLLIVFKHWLELLKKLHPNVVLNPRFVPSNSLAWLQQCTRFISDIVVGISRVYLEYNDTNIDDQIREVAEAFQNSHLSFHMFEEEDLRAFRRLSLPTSELISTSGRCAKEFVFVHDREQVDNIISFTSVMLDYVRTHVSDKDQYKTYLQKFPYDKFQARYYALDNTNITIFQNFAFQLATTDPTLTELQIKFINDVRSIISIRAKLSNYRSIQAYFHLECKNQTERYYLLNQFSQERADTMKSIYKEVKYTDDNVLLFSSMYKQALAACSDFENTTHKPSRKIHIDYLNKVVQMVLINDEDFFSIPFDSHYIIEGFTSFDMEKYIELFKHMPTECESKLLLGNYIYHHIDKLSADKQVEFLQEILAHEVKTKKTTSLFVNVLKHRLHFFDRGNQKHLKFHHTIVSLINGHNKIIDESHIKTWWQEVFDWFKYFVYPPENLERDRITLLSGSMPILPPSKSIKLQEESSASSENQPSTAETTELSPTAASAAVAEETPGEEKKNILQVSLGETLRNIFLTQVLLDAPHKYDTSIILDLGSRLINGNLLISIHKTFKNICAGLATGKYPDFYGETLFTRYQKNRNIANELATDISEFIRNAVVEYVDQKGICLESGEKLYHDNDFTFLCCLLIEEQIKFMAPLNFKKNTPFHQVIMNLAENICCDNYDPLTEHEFFSSKQLTSNSAKSGIKVKISKKFAGEFLANSSNQVHNRNSDHVTCHLLPGEVLKRAIRFYKMKREKKYGIDYKQRLLFNGNYAMRGKYQKAQPKETAKHTPLRHA